MSAPRLSLSVPAERTREQMQDEALLLAIERFAHQVHVSIQAAGDVIRRACEALERFGLVAVEQPTDPRERALWAMRNRGTGPATPAAWHKR